MTLPFIVTIGICGGILAGAFGVGGGLIVVPALVILGGYTQSTASGVSLVALLAPVGVGGVLALYQAGKIGTPEIRTGLLISLGMFLGSFIGAKIAMGFSDVALKRAFCLFLLVVTVKFWLQTLGKAGV
jgi:hypothetical protein